MTSDGAAPAPEAKTHEPVRAAERLDAIDIIRGFALFGILMVNLEAWFRGPQTRYELGAHPYPGLADVTTERLIGAFFDGKFISLFSMLFAIGLSIQMERVDARGGRFGRFALRRLGALLVLGVAHIALLWWGDILHIYALNGLLLLLFLRRKTKTVVIWAICLISLPAVVSTIFAVIAFVRPPPARPPIDKAAVQEAIDNAVRIYRSGTWIEIAKFRFADYRRELPAMVNTIPFSFMGFLIGLSAWKAGIITRPAEHRTLLRRILIFGLLAGVTVAVVREIVGPPGSPGPIWLRRFAWGLTPASTLAQAAAYASGILLLLQSEAWRARLAPLTYAGRMALTNYLLQSLLCSLVFYSFGLGLYDRLGPAACVLVVIAIYAFELALSRWWLGRYRFGPVEWLWRSITYGQMQPMRSG